MSKKSESKIPTFEKRFEGEPISQSEEIAKIKLTDDTMETVTQHLDKVWGERMSEIVVSQSGLNERVTSIERRIGRVEEEVARYGKQNERMMGSLREELLEAMSTLSHQLNSKPHQQPPPTPYHDVEDLMGSESIFSPPRLNSQRPKATVNAAAASNYARAPINAEEESREDASRDHFRIDRARATLTALPMRSGNRRVSFIARQIDETSSLASQVQYTKRQPEHSHIVLTTLSARGVYKWHDLVQEFQIKHKCKIDPIGGTLDETTRRDLAARTNNVHTEFSIMKLDLRDLTVLLMKQIAPTCRLDFQKTLDELTTLQLPQNYKPSLMTNFMWHKAMLQYVHDYRKAYEFLTETYDDDEFDAIVPPCDHKEGGLIKLFTSKIPYQYGSRVYTNTMASQKFTVIHEFLNKFQIILSEHHKLLKKLAEYRLHYGGTMYTSLYTMARNQGRTNERQISDRQVSQSTFRRGYHQSNDDRGELNFIGDESNLSQLIEEEQELEFFFSGLEDTVEDNPENRDAGYAATSAEQFDIDYDEDDIQYPEATDEGNAENGVDRSILNAFEDLKLKSTDNSQLGCYKKIFTGRCTMGPKCRFSHHPSALSKTRDAIIKKLATTRFDTSDQRPAENHKLKDVPVPQRTILQRSGQQYRAPERKTS